MTTGIPVEDWIAHHARFAPRSEAAHDLASGRRFTYAQFDERISRAALWLSHTFGVGQGDRVAVYRDLLARLLIMSGRDARGPRMTIRVVHARTLGYAPPAISKGGLRHGVEFPSVSSRRP